MSPYERAWLRAESDPRLPLPWRHHKAPSCRVQGSRRQAHHVRHMSSVLAHASAGTGHQPHTASFYRLQLER